MRAGIYPNPDLAYAGTVRQLEAIGRTQRSAVTALRDELQTIIGESFETRRSPQGAAWAPLKRPRPNGRILHRTGRLRREATRGRIEGTSTVTFTFPGYGGLHQLGASRLPARPFLPMPTLGRGVEQRLASVLVRAWFRL